MQLTTRNIIGRFETLNQLTGYPRAIELNGATQVIIEPHDIGPKAQWNIVKNRRLFRPFKDMFDELMADKKKILTGIVSTFDKNAAPGVNERLFASAQTKIDADQKQFMEELHDVTGLLKIPAKEIRIRRTDTNLIPVLEQLLADDMLDGEPDVGEPTK